MKTQNTPENKAAFLLQYANQAVCEYSFKDNSDSFDYVRPITLIKSKESIDNWCAWLTPLSAISDEDAIQVARYLGFNWEEPGYARAMLIQLFEIPSGASLKEDLVLKQLLFDFSDISSVVDFLRSKGYAYRWRDLSVEDLLSYGWIRLKGGKNES